MTKRQNWRETVDEALQERVKMLMLVGMPTKTHTHTRAQHLKQQGAHTHILNVVCALFCQMLCLFVRALASHRYDM